MCVCRETAGLRAVIPEEQASLHMLEQLEKLAKETEAAAQVPVYIFCEKASTSCCVIIKRVHVFLVSCHERYVSIWTASRSRPKPYLHEEFGHESATFYANLNACR